LNEARGTWRRFGAALVKGGRKMKKPILAIAGSALIALSAVQFAAASEHPPGRSHHRVAVGDSNAYAPPAYVAAQPEWSAYPYNGGLSAPAGR
jgi:hypothetical protein